MARIVDIRQSGVPRHLFWKCDRKTFVTVCEDGNVIFNGVAMTLSEATSIILKEKGIPPSFFWEP